LNCSLHSQLQFVPPDVGKIEFSQAQIALFPPDVGKIELFVSLEIALFPPDVGKIEFSQAQIALFLALLFFSSGRKIEFLIF